jgi:hypothetical protein
MQAIFAVTLPFFALVLLGYLAARRHLLPLAAVPGLNAYVLYFALPCLLFRFGENLPVRELLDPVVLAVYLLCAVIVVFFTIAVTLSQRVLLKDAAFGALVAAFPNTGFMGVPLLTTLLGPAAAGPVITTVLADLFVTSSLCIGLASHKPHHELQHGPDGHHSDAHDGLYTSLPGTDPARLQPTTPAPAPAGSPVLRSLRAALANPLPWAIGLGALASALQLTLPGPLARIVAMLADSASPVALFTIGAVLWRSQLASASQRVDTEAARQAGPPSTLVEERARIALPRGLAGTLHELPVALIKLLLHPLLVLLAGLGARALGAPLGSFQLMVLVLAAALPSASNVSLLTERYRADTGRVARIIMISTVLAFGSFSLIAWAFGVQPR